MTPSAIVDRFRPDLAPFEALYQDLHRHPELSRFEARTASVISSHLRRLGFRTHNDIGGHGVVGVLENGPGKTVMLRAELEALPIEERTCLPYASKVRQADWWGRDQPVMHACGHDLHMACLMAAGKLLLDARAEWTGTLIVLFQPNGAHVSGARAMVDDGLYDKIPVPDVVMAQHLMPIRSGAVSIRPGPVLASAEIVTIQLFTTMGYAANPHLSVDGTVVASKIIVQLDDLARKVAGGRYACIHINQIHAGGAGIDWADRIDIVLYVKAYDQDIRQRIFDGIKELADIERLAAGASKEPQISRSVWAPATVNDAQVARLVRRAFVEHFGEEQVLSDVPSRHCDDFSILARAKEVPYLFWFLGRVDSISLEAAEKEDRFLDMIAIEQSPLNAPLLHPTLETGMGALAVAALSFLAHAQ